MKSTSKCETTESAEPFQFLIDSALDYVRQKDPNWDHFQPVGFRATVVERWKNNVNTELLTGGVLWSLPIGDREFSILRPLFAHYDALYNPYVRNLAELVRPGN